MKKFRLSIHIFRRDLRLHDNTALIAALSQSDEVIPVFIFDERQLSNPYKGENSFRFMINCIEELDQELRSKGSCLYLFRGIADEVIEKLLNAFSVDAVFVNRDYTPFSRMRDDKMAEVCSIKNVFFSTYSDALLTEPEQVFKSDGKPYTIFTPFFRKAKEVFIQSPVQNQFTNYFSGEISSSLAGIPDEFKMGEKSGLLLTGGRHEGENLLSNLENLTDYDILRDIPSVSGTSHLSAHHKFGTVSIRETYHRIVDLFGKEHTLVSELYWRDFFTHIGFHFPSVYGKSFNLKYENLEWENDKEKFEKWCAGTTGFPIVDAGMRELVATGYMHNRVRMIVASFLVKDLHIDWRWGERFFANHLIDYDPAVNNGNWQWAASTGCDAQPYFRIFNPWRQQQKFDPDCVYIKKWIPELVKLGAKEIHKMDISKIRIPNYPLPVVDHGLESNHSKEFFSKLK